MRKTAGQLPFIIFKYFFFKLILMTYIYINLIGAIVHNRIVSRALINSGFLH
jgi:hypothetical protein